MRLVDADEIKLPDDLPYKASVKRVLALAPTVEAVSKGLYEQIKWERDVAIDQLASYGVALGEKAELAPVVHGRWVQDGRGRFEHRYRCSACNYRLIDEPCNYCPGCGDKLRRGVPLGRGR